MNQTTNNDMSYYHSKTIKGIEFSEAIDLLKEELKKVGFGIITSIDIKETFKQKIDVDFKDYMILGACNPHFAYKALQSEDKIGLFLPCNFIVTNQGDGNIEIAAIDPIASMAAVDNEDLGDFAIKVRESLISVINNL